MTHEAKIRKNRINSHSPRCWVDICHHKFDPRWIEVDAALVDDAGEYRVLGDPSMVNDAGFFRIDDQIMRNGKDAEIIRELNREVDSAGRGR